MAVPSFHIEITKQGWLGTPTDDYDPAAVDLCSHGDIRLVIGGEVIEDGVGGEGHGVSETALGLLRTINSDYRGEPDEPYADRLIPHGCGLILMRGCGVGIDWSVEHLGDQVRIGDVVRYESPNAANAIRYPGLEVLVASSDYRAEIVAFAQHAKEPFQGIDKSFSNDDDRADYIAFWKEYDQLLRAAHRALMPDGHPPEVLNDYAKRVAPQLVAAFPQHAEQIDVDNEGDVRLELECPSDSVFAGLSIETYAALEYVIVSFDTGHADYSDWHGDGTDDHIHEAMQAAHDILNERLVAVAWYSRRGMAAATLDTPENALATLQRSQQAALRRSQTLMARIRRRLGLPHGQVPSRLGDNLDQGRVTLRSWNGSHDADSATSVL